MSFRQYIYPDAQQAIQHCGDCIIELLEETLAGESYATFALSGGTSPRPMFEQMARAKFDWTRVHIFWVDERAVPPTDAQSNYRMAEEALLKPAHIPARNVHRIQAELQPDEAARRYKDELKSFFGLSAGEMPHFDVIHCGMGPDAHTASLFPGEPLIDDRDNLAAAVWVEKLQKWRITLLPGVLLAARHTKVLVCGADKAEAIKHVFDGPFDTKQFPAQLLAHQTRSSVWFLDADAARLIQ